jgi:biopolymer transport protein ExbD
MNGRRARMGGITSFIDLLFILLFGMLALSDTKQAANAELVRVRLPHVEPGNGEGGEDGRSIVVEVDAGSNVRLEGREGRIDGPEALDAALAGIVGEDLPESFTIEIRGDASADHGVMVALLQHLRRRGFAGVNLLALGTEGAAWGGGE